MKKNRMMRLASVLVVCVLLTTSVIGGTFAKYVTKVTVTGDARVAKWGVTFTTGSDLFAAAYKDTAVDDDTATVKVITANDDSKLVAPGTEGTGISLSAVTQTDNKPEVSYAVSIKLDDDPTVPTLKYTPDGGGAEDSYTPVKFILNDGTTDTEKTLDELKTGIGYIYDVATDKYYMDANVNGVLDDSEKATALTAAPTITIKWKWAIETGDNDTAKALNSKLDTILGDKAAGMNVTDATKYILPDGIASVSAADTAVNLNWTMTATQID